jgi:hypothetical protein
MSSNIAADAGAASNASRSISAALICSSNSSSRSSSRLICALRCFGKGRPSPVLSSSSRRRRSRRSGSYSDTPWENSNPLIRFHVLDPLGDQHLAFAAETAAVLFLGSRRLDHCTQPPSHLKMQRKAVTRAAAVTREGKSNLSLVSPSVPRCCKPSTRGGGVMPISYRNQESRGSQLAPAGVRIAEKLGACTPLSNLKEGLYAR